MRLFEAMLFVISLMVLIFHSWRVSPGREPWSRGTALLVLEAAVLLGLLLAHLLRGGARWQMLPAYAGCMLTVVLVATAGQPGTAAVFKLRHLGAVTAGLLLVASVALCWVLPVFRLPAPTGPHAVGTRTLHVVDRNRAGGAREVVAQLWYPALPAGEHARYARPAELKWTSRYRSLVRTNAFQDAPFAEGGPWPVLLFHPRWRGARTQDTFLAEDLASHGFVVVAIDHPGNAAMVELSGDDGQGSRVVKSTASTALDHVETSSAPAIEALWAAELAVWTADNRLVLDHLLAEKERAGSWLAHRLDPQRIAAFGHSFGGATAIALLGQDPRVRAGLNLDGWNFSAVAHRAEQPAMFVYAGTPHAAAPHNGDQNSVPNSVQDSVPNSVPNGVQNGVEGALDREDSNAVEQSLARFGGIRAYVRDTQHLDFTDNGLFSPLQRLTYTGPLPGVRAREITRALVLAFFERTLNGSTKPLPEFPEVNVMETPTRSPQSRAP